MKLVTSPDLNENDVDAINRGRDKKDVIRDAMNRSLEDVVNQLTQQRLEALSWLIAQDKLEVKIAIRTTADGKYSRGIYHEKFGIFIDEQNDAVSFEGSGNETEEGLVENYESIKVFWSWNDDRGDVADHRSRFDKLWKGDPERLDVLEFTDVSNALFARYRSTRPPHHRDPEETPEEIVPTLPSDGRPVLPPDITLHVYQEEARSNWLTNQRTGMLKMATGTGKTFTALSIASSLAENNSFKAVIIVCPFNHLVEQWDGECRRFGMDPVLAHVNTAAWYQDVANRLFVINDASSFLTVISTAATFQSDVFQGLLRDFPTNTLFIVDEVHNAGAAAFRERLPSHIEYRLGISATPERWFDEEGTNALVEYFGPVIQPELTLEDAIKKYKTLCEYRYFPIVVELTTEEQDEYRDLSRMIAARTAFVGVDDDDAALNSYLQRRARLMTVASNKLPELINTMQDMSLLDARNMLIYCGAGKVNGDDDRRQIEAVIAALGGQMNMRLSSYTEKDKLPARRTKMRQLEDGTLQALVAIRCLDEGVDIPKIHSAIIVASSTNPKQFIQRRGRILRKFPGKDTASIYDMVVVPPLDETGGPGYAESDRSMVRKEIRRFKEFAKLALNGPQATDKLLPILERFDLVGEMFDI
jgi:superfamily II DNA or RNA helicase